MWWKLTTKTRLKVKATGSRFFGAGAAGFAWSPGGRIKKFFCTQLMDPSLPQNLTGAWVLSLIDSALGSLW